MGHCNIFPRHEDPLISKGARSHWNVSAACFQGPDKSEIHVILERQIVWDKQNLGRTCCEPAQVSVRIPMAEGRSGKPSLQDSWELEQSTVDWMTGPVRTTRTVSTPLPYTWGHRLERSRAFKVHLNHFHGLTLRVYSVPSAELDSEVGEIF